MPNFCVMTLVIVYVGAVAVLFLFVVMMLNINEVLVKEGFKVFPSWVALNVYIFNRINYSFQRSRVF